MERETIRKIPKVELHCHFDGSVSREMLRTVPGWKTEYEEKITAPVPCHSLAEYLTCFGVILPFLQTREALRAAAIDVLRQGAEENTVYMEVRIAPGQHCQGGLSEAAVCRAVLEGLELGEKRYGMKSRMIFCMMRGRDMEYNRKTLRTAKAFLGYGVAGVDLAGDEAAYPVENYRELFEEAAKAQIPFTIHAGECGSADSVRLAVEMGASRIGHGVAIAEEAAVKELCRKQQICLEMCPVSNLQTKAVQDVKDYPFLRFRREGLCATIHTDNRTVSGTTLTGEWELLCRQFPEIDEKMIREANRDALKSAFLPEWEKREILKKFYG